MNELSYKSLSLRALAILALAFLFPAAAAFAQDFWEQAEPGKYVQTIRVVSPELRSDVQGKVNVRFFAPGMDQVMARSVTYSPKGKAGHIVLTPKPIQLTRDGFGEFTFRCSDLPYGPITVQLYALNSAGQRDIFELQLYNTSRKIVPPSGIPDTIPAPAKGMALAFSDDFDGPLSISKDGRGARYNAHKPKWGDFSGWPFSDPEGELNPFDQRDTYMIIKARKPAGTRGSSGLIASVDMDDNGFWAKAPFYMECRFQAHSSSGTWPAFWTITNTGRGGGDELDIVEAYGGWGDMNPNDTGYYTTSHFWGKRGADGKPVKHPDQYNEMREISDGTSWSEAFHTYGLYVDKENTIYYLDDQEVWRHPTNPVSYERPHVFMVNYAIGGGSGWYIDLERYGNASDMFVDYVRVFTKAE